MKLHLLFLTEVVFSSAGHLHDHLLNCTKELIYQRRDKLTYYSKLIYISRLLYLKSLRVYFLFKCSFGSVEPRSEKTESRWVQIQSLTTRKNQNESEEKSTAVIFFFLQIIKSHPKSNCLCVFV